MISLTHAFGFSAEPFAQDVPTEKLFGIPGLQAFLDRFDYAVRIGAATVITGDVGTGKSTSLRAATARLHPTQYLMVTLVASSGSVLDFLKGLALSLGAPEVSSSTTKLIRDIRQLLSTVTAKKQQPIIIIDEAHLLRLELLAQLHALTQLPYDQRTLAPIILSGQNILVDRLLFHTSRPFASRIIGRTLLQGLKRDDMHSYLTHHLSGLLRRANALAKGALLAAASAQVPAATAEHVRLASTEIF